MTTRTTLKPTVQILAAAVLVIAGSSSRAQADENEEYNKSITAYLGGVASITTAQANNLKAVGDYLQKFAAISQLQEQVRQLQMANDMVEAQNWYAKKKLYGDYRKSRKSTRLDAKKLAELARNQAPVRLTATEVHRTASRVAWPALLERECFDQKRAEIERLMADRSPDDSGVGSQNCAQIQRAVAQLKDLLKGRIEATNPMDYVAAKKFLDRLAYEARFVATPPIEAVARK